MPLSTPTLLTVEQVGKDQIRATWEPYTAPDGTIIYGSLQGFADSGKSTHVVGNFLYMQQLALGTATAPLDRNTVQGATVKVSLFVSATGQPSVESAPLTFQYSKSGK